MRLAYAYIAPPEAPARADPCPFVRRVFRTLALDLPQTFEVFAHAGGHGDAAVRFRTPADREAAMRRQPFKLDGATMTLLRGYDPVSQASASIEPPAAAAAEGASARDESAAAVGASANDESAAAEGAYASDETAAAEGASASDKTAAAEGALASDETAAAAEGASAGVAKGSDSKDLQQQSKALDKLTDHVEDRQLDSSRVQSAMAALASSKKADRNAMTPREKELDAVQINTRDVEIIANELELDRKIAEKTLREHKGDAVAAVRFLLR
ncbi:unnamed protein product [Alopecurus aequalis]